MVHLFRAMSFFIEIAQANLLIVVVLRFVELGHRSHVG